MAKRRATLEELEKLIEIDTERLDVELAEQPDLIFEAGEHVRFASEERDIANLELKKLEQRLISRAKEKMKEGKLLKRTATEIKLLVWEHKKFKAAQQTLTKASSKLAKAKNINIAFTQRGYALKDLVKIQLANLYSEYGGEGRRLEDLRAATNRKRLKKKRKHYIRK